MGEFKALIEAYVGHEVGDPERIAKLIDDIRGMYVVAKTFPA